MRLPALTGLEVTLVVDEENMQEYDDEDAEDAERTRFVEATSGANFAVEVRIGQRFVHQHKDLEVRVYLDGVYADGMVLGARTMTPYIIGGRAFVRQVTGKYETRNGQGCLRKFAFADLTTHDNAPKPELKKKLANIGEVSVKIWTVQMGASAPASNATFEERVGSAGIPEKALKGRAISSRATLDKAIPASLAHAVRVSYPWGRDPFASFTFKYRSRKDLQIEGIIPRSPSPVPLEDRDPETLSAEEARELVRIQRQKLQDQAKVKKEKRERDDDEDAGEDDGEVTMTGERNKRPRLSNDSGIEVIDLSNEDDEDDD